MLTLTRNGCYPAKSGAKHPDGSPVMTFRYLVNGPKAELDRYESIKGEYARPDKVTGKMLYFDNKALDNGTELIITPEDKIYPNTEEIEFAKVKAASLGDNALGREYARAAAAKLFGNTVSAPASVTAPKEVSEETMGKF